MAGKRRPVNSRTWSRDFRPRAGAGGGHRGGIGFLIYWVVPGIPLIPAFAWRRYFLRPMLWRSPGLLAKAHPEKNHGHFAGRSVDE